MGSFNPSLTVLMPVFNGGIYLEEAIDSILKQTYQNFEFLIINDCSTDNSIEIIKSFTSKKIILVNNDRNLGQSATMNKGLKLSKGIYIARMDQDDLSDYQRLEKQVFYFLKNECSVLGTWSYSIDCNSKITGYIKHPTSEYAIRNALGIDCALSHSSVMMKKKDILSVGGYSENFKIAMDWDLWIRVVNNGLKIGNLPEYLISTRLHDSQTSIGDKGKRNLIDETIYILNRSKSLINNSANYNAYIGWKYYYDILAALIDKKWVNIIKILFFGKYRLRGLVEWFKLIIFHKLIKKPGYFYNTAVIYKKI